MTKLIGSLVLATMAVAMAPQTVLAYDVPIQASFAVAFASTPNTGNVAYCGGTPLTNVIEAHGDGFSTLGVLSFSLQKTGNGHLFHGCLTLTAANGDTLTATYDLVGGVADANHFVHGAGTLTFTGGTGLFSGAAGSGTFTVVSNPFYPASSFVPVQGMAFYVVQGKVSIGGTGDRQ